MSDPTPEFEPTPEHINELRELRARQILYEWNCPKRHFECRPTLEGVWAENFEALKSQLGSGMLVALVGIRGNGKTQMAIELMKSVKSNLKPPYYLSAIEFFMLLKASYRKDSDESERDIIKRLRKYPLLVLDEVAKRGETDWENNLLFELLDKRYGDKTDTVLIANLLKADLVAMVGPSLARRMDETGGIVECTWPAFRK